MTTISSLDPAQTLRNSFDDGSNSLRVNVVNSSASELNVIASYAITAASVNGSGGAVYQIVATTSANISKLVPNEQTGTALNLYTGSPGNEVVLLIIAPGQDNIVEVNIPSGTRLSIRALGASAPAAGSCYLTFIG